MARIPYPDPASLQPETQEFVAKNPNPLNIFRMLAGGEGMLRAFSRFGNHLLFKTKLDPVLREIAILRVGVLSDATYEMHQHDRIARGIDRIVVPVGAFMSNLEEQLAQFGETVIKPYAKA